MKPKTNAKSIYKPAGVFFVTCRRPDGSIRWQDTAKNLVVDTGVDFLLDNGVNSTEAGTLYISLKNAGTIAAGDTMASHSGWTENQNYSEATRPAWGQGSASSKQVTNASTADFSIDTDTQTIAGMFITTNNTIGGTTGTLVSAADFSSSKAADNGDTIQVTYTLSGADDGV